MQRDGHAQKLSAKGMSFDGEAEDGHDAAHAKGHGGGHHHAGGHHEEEEGGEPWLLSYADMVTLLMCFFILFFQVEKSTGKYDEPQKVLARLKMLVGSNTTADKAALDADENRAPTPQDPTSSLNLDAVFALGQTEPNTIEIVMLTSNMFVPGLAKLTADGMAAIEAVARQLQTMPGDALLEVEGHTDSDPIKNSKFFDNWELSSERATSVVRVLAKMGIDPHRMRAAGLAHFQPLVPDRDDRGFAILSNQAMNRRIVVRLKMKPVASAAGAGSGSGSGSAGAGKKSR